MKFLDEKVTSLMKNFFRKSCLRLEACHCQKAHCSIGWLVFFFSFAQVGLARMWILPEDGNWILLSLNGVFAVEYLFYQFFRCCLVLYNKKNADQHAHTMPQHRFCAIICCLLLSSVLLWGMTSNLFGYSSFDIMISLFYWFSKYIFAIVVILEVFVWWLSDSRKFLESISAYLRSCPLPLMAGVFLVGCFFFDYIRLKSLDERPIKEFSKEFMQSPPGRADTLPSAENPLCEVSIGQYEQTHLHFAMLFLGNDDFLRFLQTLRTEQMTVERELTNYVNPSDGNAVSKGAQFSRIFARLEPTQQVEILCMQGILLAEKDEVEFALDFFRQALAKFKSIPISPYWKFRRAMFQFLKSLQCLLKREDFYLAYAKTGFGSEINELANETYWKIEIEIIGWYCRLYNSTLAGEIQDWATCRTDSDSIYFAEKEAEYLRTIHTGEWGEICSQLALHEKICGMLVNLKAKNRRQFFPQTKEECRHPAMAVRYWYACESAEKIHNRYLRLFELLNELLSVQFPNSQTGL